MVPTAVPLFYGLWNFLFGVGNLTPDNTIAFAAKALRLNAYGQCTLFDGIQHCAETSEQKHESSLLISDLRSTVLSDDDYTDDQRMFYTYEKLHGFYVRHPDWIEQCANTSVYNGITMQRFIRAAKTFKQLRNLNKVIGGDSTLLVEYLTALQDETTLGETMQDQIRMMVENLNEYFQKEHRIFKRLAYVVGQTVELLSPRENGVYIDMTLGSWGSFDDFLQCYDYYKKQGFHWNDPAEKTVHCLAASSLIRMRPDNSTALTSALQAGWERWSSISHRSAFKGYLKRIRNLVEGKVPGITTAQKLVEIAKILQTFRPVGKHHDSLMTIQISNWGSVKEFCDCQNIEL